MSRQRGVKARAETFEIGADIILNRCPKLRVVGAKVTPADRANWFSGRIIEFRSKQD
jgi:hypothetical protein